MTPHALGTIGIFASAFIATGGFLGFALMARFWTSRGGWHVFWFMLVIAWVLDLIVVRSLVGDSPWFAWVRAVSFAVGMPFVLGWRSWLIFDLQWFQRRRRQVAYADPRQEEAQSDGDRLGS